MMVLGQVGTAWRMINNRETKTLDLSTCHCAVVQSSKLEMKERLPHTWMNFLNLHLSFLKMWQQLPEFMVVLLGTYSECTTPWICKMTVDMILPVDGTTLSLSAHVILRDGNSLDAFLGSKWSARISSPLTILLKHPYPHINNIEPVVG